MVVIVHLHTILQRHTPDGSVEDRLAVTLPPGSTLTDLLDHLAVALPPDALLLVVNGRMAHLHQPLHEGDQVHLMPAMSGGAR